MATAPQWCWILPNELLSGDVLAYQVLAHRVPVLADMGSTGTYNHAPSQEKSEEYLYDL